MGRFNFLGGQNNLLDGQMSTQLTCYLHPCSIAVEGCLLVFFWAEQYERYLIAIGPCSSYVATQQYTKQEFQTVGKRFSMGEELCQLEYVRMPLFRIEKAFHAIWHSSALSTVRDHSQRQSKKPTNTAAYEILQ